MARLIAALFCSFFLTTMTAHAARHPLPNVTQFCGDRYCPSSQIETGIVKRHRHHERRHAVERRHAKKRVALPRSAPIRMASVDPTDMPRIPGTDLLARARHYLGTNPGHWSSLWCGRFMAMIAPDAARLIDNPAMAREWGRLRHVAPQVGAIAVLSRGRSRYSGHVGVVESFDRNGNPIIISGNHGRKVGRGTYPKWRVLAYVSP